MANPLRRRISPRMHVSPTSIRSLRNVWPFRDARGTRSQCTRRGPGPREQWTLSRRTCRGRDLGVIHAPDFIVGPDVTAGKLTPILREFQPPAASIYVVYPVDVTCPRRFGPSPIFSPPALPTRIGHLPRLLRPSVAGRIRSALEPAAPGWPGTAPVTQHDESTDHAAQMREMRDTGLHAGNAHDQFQHGIHNDECARGHRDGWKQ